jgi:hypothetical protein
MARKNLQQQIVEQGLARLEYYKMTDGTEAQVILKVVTDKSEFLEGESWEVAL